ncbi:MAG: single-stranded DNA exonuclease RecJ, partial [Nitrosopumilaceae archaeon]|nr:single-stranded DNA exonuclease RecJ [Nitrosopumilaceae archaeon]
MSKQFDDALSNFENKISDCIKSGKSIFVVTHIDCDGITSGSIITKALIRAGAKCTIRTFPEINKNVIANL